MPAAHATAGHDRDAARMVGYFTERGVYGRNFVVRDAVANGTVAKLTHLNYAFGFLDSQGKRVTPWSIATDGKGCIVRWGC